MLYIRAAMCTIAVLHRVSARHPLAVVANRDELRSRPTAPPRVLHRTPRAVGGVDLLSGGTWMGANEHHLFVGLTNQRSLEPPDRSKRSRGEVVLAALAERDAESVARHLASIDAREHNGFNLIFGVLGDVRVAYARPDARTIEIERVAEGITVLANDRLESAAFPKTARAASLALHALDHVEDGGWARLLADHALPPIDQIEAPPADARFDRAILHQLQALCIHLPFYGTVSATAMLFGPGGGLERYLFAAGQPCDTPFDDVTHLLEQDR